MTGPASPRVVNIDTLAEIWVRRWLQYGGGLIVDRDCDRVSLSMDLDGRRWRSRHPTLHQRSWHDGWTVGRWRELQELASDIPGLREAIIDHVMEYGRRSIHGSTCMAAEHPWEAINAA